MRTLQESLIDDFEDQTKDLKRLQIEEWLKKNNASKAKYIINKDYTIDIDTFWYKGKGNFPEYIQFNRCNGGFYCVDDKLTSLKGCPEKIGKDFYCSNNQLTSLEGCPKEVGGNFGCSNNQLTSLEGCPEEIGGSFYCYDNHISEKEKLWAEQNIKCRDFYWE